MALADLMDRAKENTLRRVPDPTEKQVEVLRSIIEHNRSCDPGHRIRLRQVVAELQEEGWTGGESRFRTFLRERLGLDRWP